MRPFNLLLSRSKEKNNKITFASLINKLTSECFQLGHFGPAVQKVWTPLVYSTPLDIDVESKVQKWKVSGGKSSPFITVLAQNAISREHVPDVRMMNLLSQPEVGLNLAVIIHAQIFGAFPSAVLCSTAFSFLHLCVSPTGLRRGGALLLPERRGE